MDHAKVELFGKDLHRLAGNELREMAMLLIELSEHAVIDQTDIIRYGGELVIVSDDGTRCQYQQFQSAKTLSLETKSLTFD